MTNYFVASCFDNDALTSYETYSQDRLELVHNNFGWGGDRKGIKSNSTGWNHIGIFNTHSNIEESSNTYKSGVLGNFQYEKK